MKKIGIISELNFKSINYGNRLQAYALNSYIKRHYSYDVHSLVVVKSEKKYKRLSAKFQDAIDSIYIYIKDKFYKNCEVYVNNEKLLRLLNNFTKTFVKPEDILSYNLIKKSNFYLLIVGSDIVWYQYPRYIDKTKFLDFKNNKNIKKISYAASFGNCSLDKKNIPYITKQLKNFSNISVRENVAVQMLESINIKNVAHVCDPTLLLEKNEWSNIESPPTTIKLGDKFIFVYLLNCSTPNISFINKFASELNLSLVFVFGDALKINNAIIDCSLTLNECSIENWLWLANHSEYIITDSFHGVVFSTIFNKKFFALSHLENKNPNIRIMDYLNTIDEKNKMININDFNLSDYNWDYIKINKNIALFKQLSIEYLDTALNVL